MTGGTLAWGIAFAVLCVATGITIGYPIGHARGLKHAAEDAADTADAATIASWKDLPDEDPRPAPPWPAVPPTMPPEPPLPRPGAGKHRHPAGPRHAALPAAGYLPAEPGPWGGTITVPAPGQAPPWDSPDAPAYRPDQLLRGRHDSPDLTGPLTDWEPVPVLEPTAADCLPPDTLTDTGWTRQMAADMDQWIAEHITATDSTLKEITR